MQSHLGRVLSECGRVVVQPLTQSGCRRRVTVEGSIDQGLQFRKWLTHAVSSVAMLVVMQWCSARRMR